MFFLFLRSPSLPLLRNCSLWARVFPDSWRNYCARPLRLFQGVGTKIRRQHFLWEVPPCWSRQRADCSPVFHRIFKSDVDSVLFASWTVAILIIIFPGPGLLSLYFIRIFFCSWASINFHLIFQLIWTWIGRIRHDYAALCSFAPPADDGQCGSSTILSNSIASVFRRRFVLLPAIVGIVFVFRGLMKTEVSCCLYLFAVNSHLVLLLSVFLRVLDPDLARGFPHFHFFVAERFVRSCFPRSFVGVWVTLIILKLHQGDLFPGVKVNKTP